MHDIAGVGLITHLSSTFSAASTSVMSTLGSFRVHRFHW
ncbi:hypothetical protein Zm00014a_001078 [Zea mays]|uniref:Uncharacterized protein n=1 Tax=Zea mays TaxID=4577 RepID=A0A317YJ98_MAIZE|nr:hypothetical protein Zm00014a_001078 [Zea mays]